LHPGIRFGLRVQPVGAKPQILAALATIDRRNPASPGFKLPLETKGRDPESGVLRQDVGPKKSTTL
jgi:hypothetical protein